MSPKRTEWDRSQSTPKNKKKKSDQCTCVPFGQSLYLKPGLYLS
jgi:hypothetical protein